jgi:3-hydroxyisobutyrate dehydrogenase-like beta-hydroxyacid dehydrogenase
MGLNMASNLQAHFAKSDLPPLLFSNRTLGKGQPLINAGAKQVSDFLSLVKASDIVFTMVRSHSKSGGSTYR